MLICTYRPTKTCPHWEVSVLDVTKMLCLSFTCVVMMCFWHGENVMLFPVSLHMVVITKETELINAGLRSGKCRSLGQIPSLIDESHPVSPSPCARTRESCTYAHPGWPPTSDTARSVACNVHKEVVMMRTNMRCHTRAKEERKKKNKQKNLT